MAVGLEHPAHAEALAQLEEPLVLVGGVEQHRVAGLGAAQHEHVVVDGPHHHLVDLDPRGVPDQRVSHADERMRRLWRIDALDQRILGIAVPALGSLLVEPIYVLTDTAVVGRLGTTSLGGLALASTVLNTLVWVFNFLSYGTTVRVAVRRGRGDPAGGAADALQALWLAAGIGLVVAVGDRAGGGLARRAGRRRPGRDRRGRDLPAGERRGRPLPVRGDRRASATSTGSRTRRRPFLVLAAVDGREPGPRAGAGVRARLGDRRQRLGHGVRADPRARPCSSRSSSPRLRADGLHRLRVVPSVMWAVVKVGAHLVQRTAFLLAALAVATAAASRVGTVELAGHQIAAQVFLFLAIGVDMFKVSGQSLVGHALGAPAARGGAGRRRPPLRVGAGGRACLLTAIDAGARAGAPSPVHRRCRRSPRGHGGARGARPRCSCRRRSPSCSTGCSWAPTTSGTSGGRPRSAFGACLPVFAAVRARPSLGIVTVWIGLLLWISVRALKNHARVQGDRWMLSADAVA